MKVFISHAHTDGALVAQITEALQRSGLEVWDADREILPGDNWAGEVARALDESQAMVVLLTPDAANSPWVKREIEYALGAKNYANRLFPVVVGDPEGFPAGELPWIARRLPRFQLENSAATDTPAVEAIAEAILSHA